MACAENSFPLLQQENLVQFSYLLAWESKPTSYVRVLQTGAIYRCATRNRIRKYDTGSWNITYNVQRLSRENR
jgi:hypothetical protein